MNYYDKNADKFYKRTIEANLPDIYSEFLPLINGDKNILDAGCGSGRDTKFFLDNGFNVDAFDASEKLSKLASTYTGIDVKCHRFLDLDYTKKYDGIWACASLLCLEHLELAENINHLSSTLKEDGVFYMSFKHGNNEIKVDGRHFNNMNEEKLNDLLPKLELNIQKTWLSKSVLADIDQKWFNIILA